MVFLRFFKVFGEVEGAGRRKSLIFLRFFKVFGEGEVDINDGGNSIIVSELYQHGMRIIYIYIYIYISSLLAIGLI